MVMLRIQPRDPMVVRDGRPFGLGNRMYSLNWPYPSTLAGMVRTLIGKLQSQADNPFANEEFLQRLKAIEVGGPLPIKNDRVFFPAPGDALLYNTRTGKRYMPLRPQRLQEGEGTDLSGQWPVEVATVTERGKPLPAPPFWSADLMEAWLCQDLEKGFPLSDQGEDVMAELPKDVRVHVSIDPQTYRAKDAELFCTKGVTFLEGNRAAGQWSEVCEIAMGARIRTGLDIERLSRAKPLLHPFGGKGRLAHITSEITPIKGWEIPGKLQSSLGKATGVRMILATPAAFAKGWLPAWLDSDSLAGTPPGVSSLKLKLKCACVARWKPISGWDLAQGKCKPVRRLVPAGSVYFFEVVAGQACELMDRWLESVADSSQDRADGFGLALWGVWNEHSNWGGGV